MRFRNSILGLSVMVALAAAPAQSDSTPSVPEAGASGLLGNLSFKSDRGPVKVASQQLEFDYKSRTLTYRGEVNATQGDLSIKSDRLIVFLEGEDKSMKLKEVVAEGSVRISQASRVATGGRAVFDQTRRTVVLSAGAVLTEGNNRLTGDKVTCMLDEERCEVDGNVHVTFIPPEDSVNGALP